MSVLIKGMTRPKNCFECHLTKWIDDGCAGCVADDKIHNASKPVDCPLVEIPEPHGEHLCEDEVVSCLEGADWINEVIRIFLDLQAEGSEDE